MKIVALFAFIVLTAFFCKKKSSTSPQPQNFLVTFDVNDSNNGTTTYTHVNLTPVFKFKFNDRVNTNSINSNFSFVNNNSTTVPFNVSLSNNDSVVVLKPANSLTGLSSYTVSVLQSLSSSSNNTLLNPVSINITTGIDSAAKFPQISDSALLDSVQKRTLKYFWDYGHPVSGLARERYTSGDVVTTGGSGFGIMAIVAGVNRGFIKRSDAVVRLNTITNFLITKCQRLHGAFSHWINGATGATVPFGNNDGADIVETSYLLEGLLTARQYFNSSSDINEITLRDSINSIWKSVEWNWFTQNGAKSSLYWQYNPSYSNESDIWSIPVTGWNEALITYVLAASSINYSISKGVYDSGWAKNGSIKNGSIYYGVTLPLGESYGGPLFFSHYSFLGINPNSLSDTYCSNYFLQNIAHAQINYDYCAANPKKYFGYSNLCWGLTASDIPNGYTASSPTNDVGVIAPTAAISSLAYTPVESMNALRFFYFTLGDKLWKDYGFVDAFNLNQPWYDPDFLAIDQGPEIVMIENYRTKLLWNLFMSCPEVKAGMTKLGFQSPNF